MNTNKSHAICLLSVCPLRASENDAAEMVSQLIFGDYVTILTAGRPWVKVRNESDGYEGWMDFKQLKFIDEATFQAGIKRKDPVVANTQLIVEGPYGEMTIMSAATLPFFDGLSCKIAEAEYVLKQPLIQAKKTDLFKIAQSYLNTPYLWGGKSFFGIDCSGLVQNIFKTLQINAPRDASQQVKFGTPIAWEKREAFDLVFFTTSSDKVTHVGVLLDKNSILHAHGRVRIDTCDEKGIFNAEQQKYTHSYHSIKRWI
ncbi:hydrolase Nlp/P60 [Putridiphycobacter roseus]|uniref:Hydrolase Nlp/P60 n=1 Tax=Putridiphycobacter roseus TaxID=2219161 RepID=A0A2W1NMF7_9FLAO|nr:NlpC/P60 family protein [Putridiphycobacter roseus]PZE16832.1 hydrolase Nlp/P60 [Putridiphycobacter roseus]